jgi:hypothetical protein
MRKRRGEEKRKRKRKRKASVLLLPCKYDLVCILVGTPSQSDLIVDYVSGRFHI